MYLIIQYMPIYGFELNPWILKELKLFENWLINTSVMIQFQQSS